MSGLGEAKSDNGSIGSSGDAILVDFGRDPFKVESNRVLQTLCMATSQGLKMFKEDISEESAL